MKCLCCNSRVNDNKLLRPGRVSVTGEHQMCVYRTILIRYVGLCGSELVVPGQILEELSDIFFCACRIYSKQINLIIAGSQLPSKYSSLYDGQL